MFLLVTLLSGGLTAGECPACTAAKICDPHAASDREALKALSEGMRNPDPEARKGAIEAFAAATREHANCRPPANASALAAAMKDPDCVVRSLAAERLGEQDARTACAVLDREADSLLKKLAKEPKGAREEQAWLDDYEVIAGVCAGLGAVGGPPAGKTMEKILTSVRLKVLDVACEYFPKIRDKAVPPAVIAAMDRVRVTTLNADRDRVWLALMKAWDAMTKANVRMPDPTDPADAQRYVQDCRAWWKANEKTWK